MGMVTNFLLASIFKKGRILEAANFQPGEQDIILNYGGRKGSKASLRMWGKHLKDQSQPGMTGS
jgi:hypothetical protein